LRNDPAGVRELLHGEIRLRRELRESLDVEELVRRFPDHAEWLRQTLAQIRLEEPTQDTSTASDEVPQNVTWPEIPGYEILGEIGRGGMGVVYKARQAKLNRFVALKMLLAGSQASAKAVARFRNEAEAIAQLQHPYIVQIFDVIEQDRQLFLSLEYVGGGGLSRKIGGRPLPVQQAVAWAHKLAQAMQYAHEHGVIHRDLKPANVLLTEDGIPKITDFGLAKRIDDATNRTRTGTVVGTPDYMSPEQAEGQPRNIGPATDIYSLGIILYEMLTGRPPFRGESMMHVLDAVRFKAPEKPSEIRPELSQDLDLICMKCLEKKPAQRYPSAGALAKDLERFLAGEQIRANSSELREFTREWLQKNWRTILAGILLLIMASLALIWLLQ
jgi:serine/threonine protein kinase